MPTFESSKRFGIATVLAMLATPVLNVAQAQQREPIQVSLNSREEVYVLTELLVSSNIVGRDGVATRMEAVRDIEVLKRLVTRGEAGNYAATFLALRQIPFVGSEGEDNIREMSARMLQTAMTVADPTSRVISVCP